jgi:acyl dehydratase
MRYFEDIPVDEEVEFGEWTLTEDEIIEFAEQWDPQPIHVDPEAAAESVHGGIIASGLHTVAIAMRLWVLEWLQDVSNLGARGLSELTWHDPVRPGETLTVTGCATEKTVPDESRDHGWVSYELAVYDADGDRRMTMVSDMAVVRREA